MSHDYERGHEGPEPRQSSVADLEPIGKTSRSALLQRRHDPVASGLVQGRPAGGVESASSVARGEGVEQGQDRSRQDRSPDMAGGDIHGVARRGVSGPSQALPHLSAIQAAFGRHDVSGVRAHVGGGASEASAALGAEAYAFGNSVAFRQEPDLFTAAHEAAHVVQQRQGVQLMGGVGQAGDDYEQHADAVAQAVVQGRSAEALLGAFARGTSSNAAVQKWTAGTPRTNTESSWTKPFLATEVGIMTPPDIILSQYKNTYTPTILLNIKGGHFHGPRGDLFVDFHGAISKRVGVPNNEGSWQTPGAATITKDMFVDPGRGNGYSNSSLFAEYDAPAMFEPGVDAKSPPVNILAFHDAFQGTGPERSKTEAQLDIDNKQVVSYIANNLEETVIHDTWSQHTSVETSTSTSVKYGKTLTNQSTTGTTLGGKGTMGGSGKPGGEINLGFSQQWQATEMETYESAPGSGWKETVGTARTFTVALKLPRGFKGTPVLYPFTQKRLDWVKSRQHDGKGHILNSDLADEKRWIGFNIPAGHATVLGVDPNYLSAFKKKFDECERQYHEAQVIERQFNASTGIAKAEFGKKLDEAKTKLRKLTEELVNLQASTPDSLADADAQIKKLAKPSGGSVSSSEVNALIVQWPIVTAWFTYAGGATTGAPTPVQPVTPIPPVTTASAGK